jgi:hypothetical protein
MMSADIRDGELAAHNQRCLKVAPLLHHHDRTQAEAQQAALTAANSFNNAEGNFCHTFFLLF